MSNKQAPRAAVRVLLVRTWARRRIPADATIGSPPGAPVHRGYCATQARGEP
jgi:hypothetical protein